MRICTPSRRSRWTATKRCLEGDPDLYNWITGKEAVPPEHESDVMQLLRAHRFAGAKANLMFTSGFDPSKPGRVTIAGAPAGHDVRVLAEIAARMPGQAA